MAVELIAKIKQKNGGTFALVDAADIDWDENEKLVDHINSIGTQSGQVSELTTRLAAVEGKVTQAETDIDAFETEVAKKAEINDAAASASTAYSGTKVESLVTAAKQAVKNEILGGAGDAFDTLKELGDLITDNQDAIGALETIAAGHVRYDAAQELTAEQKTQARTNIGAAESGAVSTLTTKVSTLETNVSALTTRVGTAETTLTSHGTQITAAKNAADAAQADADAAQTAADNAASAASTAQNDVDALKAAVGDTTVDLVAVFEEALEGTAA